MDAAAFFRNASKAIHGTLRSSGFERVGRRTMWLRTGDRLVHVVGFYGTWHGGSRPLTWGVYVPELEALFAGRDELDHVAQCHVRETPHGLDPRRPPQDLDELIVGYVRTLDGLSSLDALSDFLASDGKRDFPVRGAMTDLHLAGLAVLRGSADMRALAEAAAEGLGWNEVWLPRAERVLAAAASD